MKTITRIFAFAGFFVFVLCVAGQFGIGHFRLYYGLQNVTCSAIDASLAAQNGETES